MQEKQIKTLKTSFSKIGDKKYLNRNCWLVKNLKANPAKRCLYCSLKLKKCPIAFYAILSLFFILSSILILLIVDKEVSKTTIIVILIIVFGPAYFLNKTTERLIEANFQEKELKVRLEEAKTVLEIRVRARTRELKELSESLDKEVKERTKDLQEKIKELEKFNQMAIGRELRIIELKKQIKELKKEKK